MHVTVYEDIDEIPARAWDDVLDRSAAPVFYRHAYLQAHARSGVSPSLASRFVVVRDRYSGRPLAVCPATLQHPADPLGVLTGNVDGFAPDDRCLLTHFWQCYDSTLPALSQDAAGLAADALVETAAALDARWVGFVNVSALALGQVRAALGKASVASVADERFCMPLTGLRHLDDYLARLPPHPARNLRRYLRRAADRRVEVRQLSAAEAALDEALTLIRTTAARHRNTGMYPDGQFQDFVRRLGSLVTVIEIRDSGRLVAVGLCLLDSQRFHLWTAGTAQVDNAGYSPYGLLFLESVRAAIASGRPVLEGGRRNRDYKERHGLQHVPLHTIMLAVSASAVVGVVGEGPVSSPSPARSRRAVETGGPP